MPLSDNSVERLQALQTLLQEEKFDEVIPECTSLSSLIKQEREDDDEDEHDKQLQSILLEIQTKAYLQLDQLQEVIDLEQERNAGAEDRLGPLVAYAQYRLKNYSEAKKISSAILKTQESSNVLAHHVLAQSLYRLGETESSWKNYNSVSAPEDDVEQVQLLTNALAVQNANANPYGLNKVLEENELVWQAQELFSKEMINNGALPFDMYELAYNLGTYELLFSAAGKVDAAEEGENILKAAEQAIKDEGNSEEESIEDLAPILTNLAWSQQRRHIDGEQYPTDAEATKFITKHNTSLFKENNTSAGNKKKEADVALPVSITPLQRRLYHYNQAVLAFRRKQHTAAKSQLQLLQKCISADSKKKSSTPTAPCASSSDLDFWKSRIAVLEAHLLEQNGKGKEAKQLLKKQTFNTDSVTAWTQLHLKRMEGQLESPQDRLSVLECLPPSFQSKPAVLATRAMLYQKLGKTLPKELVDDNQRGEILFSQGNYKEALPYFESQSDSTSRAKYILCLTHTDPDKAQELASSGDDDFESDAPLSSSLSADVLEAQEIPRLKSARGSVSSNSVPLTLSTPSTVRRSHDSIMKQRAKKREAHLEKLRESGVDTTKKPDPERWLPKHERRNQRNRRRRQQHRGAQGGFSQAEAAKLDVANRAAPSAKSTAHMAVVGGETGRRGGRRR